MAPQCPAGLNCAVDRGPSVAPSVLPIFALAILAIVARLYSRHLTGHNGSPSDYTIIAGLLLSTSLTAMVVYSPRLGLGRHIEVVSPDHVQGLLITLYIGCILYAVAIAVIKVSILLLYRSLFPTPGIDLATKIIGAISIAWGIETVLVGTFSCTPVKAFWDIAVTEKKCINTTAFFIANSAVHVIIDISILILPVRKVWGLKMSTHKRVVVSFMFLLGGFICVIGIVRLFFVATLKMTDLSYTLVDTYIWSSIETSVGVICACLPTLRPLFMKLFPKAGFNTLAASAPQVYFGQDTGTRWPRIRRPTDDSESLHHLQNISGVNSNTAITITHQVEQERRPGKLRQKSSAEIWSGNY